MIKSIKAILAQDKEKFKVPRKVQDLIPIKNIWPDGIFKVGNKFSKCNQATSQGENQSAGIIRHPLQSPQPV